MSLLRYSKSLDQIPSIADPHDLAKIFSCKLESILMIAATPEMNYQTLFVAKPNGSARKLSVPNESLKSIQRKILHSILYHVTCHPAAKAYRMGYSIKSNASYHVNQNTVLRLDISNFFNSISDIQVEKVFFNIGYNTQVSKLLSRLCCCHGCLPQGAPTSPALSNIVMHKIDRMIFGFCRSRYIKYTRYADDMFFSGDFSLNQVISYVTSILSVNSFKINQRKTKVMRRYTQQRVTGVTVNLKVSAPRDCRKYLRQQIHYLMRFGINDQALRNGTSKEAWLNRLIGFTSYIRYLEPENTDVKQYLEILDFEKTRLSHVKK